MDPNLVLLRLLASVARIRFYQDQPDEDRFRHLAAEAAIVAEDVEALNGWLAAGGFLPGRWTPGRDRTPAAVAETLVPEHVAAALAAVNERAEDDWRDGQDHAAAHYAEMFIAAYRGDV
jgi:hypothetical protein